MTSAVNWLRVTYLWVGGTTGMPSCRGRHSYHRFVSSISGAVPCHPVLPLSWPWPCCRGLVCIPTKNTEQGFKEAYAPPQLNLSPRRLRHSLDLPRKFPLECAFCLPLMALSFLLAAPNNFPFLLGNGLL